MISERRYSSAKLRKFTDVLSMSKVEKTLKGMLTGAEDVKGRRFWPHLGGFVLCAL